jgi:hypothetical protein
MNARKVGWEQFLIVFLRLLLHSPFLLIPARRTRTVATACAFTHSTGGTGKAVIHERTVIITYLGVLFKGGPGKAVIHERTVIMT